MQIAEKREIAIDVVNLVTLHGSVQIKGISRINCGASHTHNDNTCHKTKPKGKTMKDQANNKTFDVEKREHSFAFQIKAQHGVNKISTGLSNKLLVDCGATAHIITDESKFSSFDQSFRPESHYTELADGTRSNNVALTEEM